jgi:hypothetical protein
MDGKTTTSEDAQIEAIEVGDEIAWTEGWTGGEKQFRATVTEIGTTHLGSALAGDDRSIRHFKFDLIEGDASAFVSDDPKLTEEQIVDEDGNVENFEHRATSDDGGGEDDDPEIMTDGGVDIDRTEHFDDAEIGESIDGTGAGELVSPVDLREYLAAIQESFEAIWDIHLDSIEDGHFTVVGETDDLLVLADHTGHGWGDELDLLEREGELAEAERPEIASALSRAHHRAAKRLCDYSWSTADPFVIAKPDGFNDGERFVDAMLMWLMDERGLSAGVALDWLMVEHRGLSQNEWSRRAGKDQSSISQNVNKAKGLVRR